MTLHSNEIYFDRLLLKDKISCAQFVVTISDYNRQLLHKLWPDLDVSDKVHVIHCGLDPDTFSPPESRQNAHEYTILGVGQLAPRKGFHVLIEACHHLAERGVDFCCHILGEGPERNRLEALIQEYELHKQVQMPGRVYQEEIGSYLNRADVFALPCVTDKSGDQDGIPVVLMEAMATELPTISTNISGIPELITHGQSGLLISSDDAVALADALQQLANDAELRRRLGKTGRETIVNAYNISQSARQMALLFERAHQGTKRCQQCEPI
jgi:glycosyltransferase involved in cell wall biosynthesis